MLQPQLKKPPLTGGKIINPRDLMAISQQTINQSTTYKNGTTRHNIIHLTYSFWAKTKCFINKKLERAVAKVEKTIP